METHFRMTTLIPLWRRAMTISTFLASFVACERTPPEPEPLPRASSRAMVTPSASASAALPAPALSAMNTLVCPKLDAPKKLAWTDPSTYQLLLDEAALRCLSDAERAAVAYVATTVGTECDWVEGTDLSAPKDMDCKLTTALGLGPQCEEKHRALVHEFLGHEMPAQCAKIPTTAFAQTILSTLSLEHQAENITLTYETVTTTGPTGKASRWSEVVEFRQTKPRTLTIAGRKKARKTQ